MDDMKWLFDDPHTLTVEQRIAGIKELTRICEEEEKVQARQRRRQELEKIVTAHRQARLIEDNVRSQIEQAVSSREQMCEQVTARLDSVDGMMENCSQLVSLGNTFVDSVDEITGTSRERANAVNARMEALLETRREAIAVIAAKEAAALELRTNTNSARTAEISERLETANAGMQAIMRKIHDELTQRVAFLDCVKEECDRIQRDRDRIAEINREKDVDIAERKKRIAEKILKQQETRARIAEKTAKLNALQEKNQKTRELLKTKQDDKARKTLKVEQMRKKLELRKEQNVASHAKLQALQKEEVDVGEELNTFRKETVQMIKDQKQKLDAELQSCREEEVMVASECATNEHKYNCEQLEGYGEWNDRPIEEMRSEVEEMRGRVETSSTSIMEMQQKIAVVGDQVKAKHEQLALLSQEDKGAMSKLCEEVEITNAELGDVEESLQTMDEQLEKKQTGIRLLESREQAQQTANAQREAELQARIASLEAELEAEKSKSKELEASNHRNRSCEVNELQLLKPELVEEKRYKIAEDISQPQPNSQIVPLPEAPRKYNPVEETPQPKVAQDQQKKPQGKGKKKAKSVNPVDVDSDGDEVRATPLCLPPDVMLINPNCVGFNGDREEMARKRKTVIKKELLNTSGISSIHSDANLSFHELPSAAECKRLYELNNGVQHNKADQNKSAHENGAPSEKVSIGNETVETVVTDVNGADDLSFFGAAGAGQQVGSQAAVAILVDDSMLTESAGEEDDDDFFGGNNNTNGGGGGRGNRSRRQMLEVSIDESVIASNTMDPSQPSSAYSGDGAVPTRNSIDVEGRFPGRMFLNTESTRDPTRDPTIGNLNTHGDDDDSMDDGEVDDASTRAIPADHNAISSVLDESVMTVIDEMDQSVYSEFGF